MKATIVRSTSTQRSDTASSTGWRRLFAQTAGPLAITWLPGRQASAGEDREASRADQIISRIKEDRFRHGKFGLLSLFLFVLLVAVSLATIRSTVGFPWFLQRLFTFSMLLYGCAPLSAWTTVNLVYHRGSLRQRAYASLLLILLVVVCFSSAAFWRFGATTETLFELLMAAVVFWPLQFVCIAVVYLLLFRKAKTPHRNR